MVSLLAQLLSPGGIHEHHRAGCPRRYLCDRPRALARGELTIKGVTRELDATGTWAGPATYLDGNERIAISLETVINRHDFGVSWNAPLPSGGNAVGDDVTLTVDLELIKS